MLWRCESFLLTTHHPEAPTSSLTCHKSTCTPSCTRALHYVQALCPTDVPEAELLALLSYFSEPTCHMANTKLWSQGARPECALLLLTGGLQGELKEEAGTIETIRPGSFVGELTLVTGESQHRWI